MQLLSPWMQSLPGPQQQARATFADMAVFQRLLGSSQPKAAALPQQKQPSREPIANGNKPSYADSPIGSEKSLYPVSHKCWLKSMCCRGVVIFYGARDSDWHLEWGGGNIDASPWSLDPRMLPLPCTPRHSTPRTPNPFTMDR